MGPIVDSSLVVIACGIFIIAIVALCWGLSRLVRYHTPERVGASELKPKLPEARRATHTPNFEYDVYREQVALGRVLPYTKLEVKFSYTGNDRLLSHTATSDMLVVFRTSLRQFTNDAQAPITITSAISDVLAYCGDRPCEHTWHMTLEGADFFPERVLRFHLVLKGTGWALQLEPDLGLYRKEEPVPNELHPWEVGNA